MKPKTHPAKQLFPTITLRDWSAALRRAREYQNELSIQIRNRKKQHSHVQNNQTAVPSE